ncbi:hypothetical protein QVD17_29507 [Tagetes erecta]|uniref:Uncharacterized protein n=1 Tax=Tagetes erecta TaxID=13708 RepID=A0AAD8KE98_TARER|nr:hypothetical protein QVD17_29507 [Tagetes erecta]
MMCDCFVFLGSIHRQSKNDRQNPLLIVNDNAYAGEELPNPTTAMTLILKSWLNGHWLRYLILLMCSPLLIPIVFVISPFLCAAEVCFCFCRRRRRLKPSLPLPPPVVASHGDEGEVNPKVSLLDRYLNDQLELALELLDECGGDLGYRYDCIDDADFDTNDLC